MTDPASRRKGLYARFHQLLERTLSKPRADRAVVWIAVCLLAFSLDTGLAADDYIHLLMARGDEADASARIEGFVRHPLDMFRFTTGPETLLLKREGVLAWWHDPQAKLAFMRPISALTHYVDHLLWEDSAWLMHLHSLAWSALALFAVLALYRALLGPGLVATLAIALYALDDARGWFVSWIAARNAVVATALSTIALLLYIRARKAGARAPGQPSGALVQSGQLASAGMLLLALLAGEGSIAIVGYMVAYAVTLDRAPLRERVLSFVPHALVIVAWRIAYRALGYGAERSGLYFDPLGDPVGYLGALVERTPILLFAQLGGTWSDAWSALFAFPTLHKVLVGTGLVVMGVMAYVIAPLVRRDPMVRFGLLGALLAVLPASTAFSADRLLTWVAIGASLVLARLFSEYWQAPSTLRDTRVRAFLLGPLMLWLTVDHAIGEPVFVPSRARGNIAMRSILDRAHAGVPSDASIADKHVIYINPAAEPLASYVPIERAAQRVPRPAFQALLATADSEVRVTRTGPRSLRVQARGGYLLSPPSQLLTGRFRRFTVGERVDLGPLAIEVQAITSDARPAIIEAHFERVLEDPIYVFRQWSDITLSPFTPPALGESVVLPSADWLRVTLGDAVRLPFDGRLPPPHDPSF